MIMESFGRTDLCREFCLHFPVTDEAFCGWTRFGFVVGDERDQLEVVVCPAVDPVSRMETRKMA